MEILCVEPVLAYKAKNSVNSSWEFGMDVMCSVPIREWNKDV